MIDPFAEPIVVLRYGAEVVGLDGRPVRPAPTAIPMQATVERGTHRIVRDGGPVYIRGIRVLAFRELLAGDEVQGARQPADRIQWRGKVYEVVEVDYAYGFAGQPEKWEAAAAEVKPGALP
jgi:hypothetical protein